MIYPDQIPMLLRELPAPEQRVYAGGYTWREVCDAAADRLELLQDRVDELERDLAYAIRDAR